MPRSLGRRRLAPLAAIVVFFVLLLSAGGESVSSVNRYSSQHGLLPTRYLLSSNIPLLELLPALYTPGFANPATGEVSRLVAQRSSAAGLYAGPSPTPSDSADNLAEQHTMAYHSGPVLATHHYVLLYAGRVDGDRTAMETFSSTILETGYLDGLSQYGVGRGVFDGGFQMDPISHTDAQPLANGNKLTPYDIQQWLLAQSANSLLPDADPGTVYAITLPSFQRVADGHPYHGAANGIIYTVLQLPALPGFWQTSSSHELVEALSDPVDQTGWSSNDTDGSGVRYELADVCEPLSGNVDHLWLVAEYYVPGSGCTDGFAVDTAAAQALPAPLAPDSSTQNGGGELTGISPPLLP